ncbi:MAG: ABC transporter substrate-binding protein [Flavobacteriaceae bacterium]|nr:MAG: ABC transporter substrate-binding protein [Flavobacteriaceae bacterium]
MRKFKKLCCLLFVITTLISCTTNKEKIKVKHIEKYIKYAKGFEISTVDNYTKLRVLSPFQGASAPIDFYIVKEGEPIPSHLEKTNYIQLPLKRMVPTSTTHIPMIELLNGAENIVGFPSTKYVSSPKTRQLIDDKKILDLGNEQQLNTEVLLDLNPQLVIAFSVNGNHKNYNTIRQMNIPIIYNGDWLEPSPLGRAEWIKFFGVLLNKEKEADSIFSSIEQNYLAAKKLAQHQTSQKIVFSGGPYKDVWNIPAGNSYEAQYYKDANLNYIFKETKGQGSLSMNVEQVFDQAQHTDIWLSPSFYSSMELLGEANAIFKEFDAYKKQEVYTTTNTRGSTGGLIYFELATTRPDFVLKDLIKIGHPDLLPNYEMQFYKKLE